MNEQQRTAKTCNFSDLPGLQKLRTVSYRFTMGPKGAYFQIMQKGPREKHVEYLTFLLPDASRETAGQLERFLHENAVSLCHCMDILYDNNIPFQILSPRNLPE